MGVLIREAAWSCDAGQKVVILSIGLLEVVEVGVIIVGTHSRLFRNKVGGV